MICLRTDLCTVLFKTDLKLISHNNKTTKRTSFEPIVCKHDSESFQGQSVYFPSHINKIYFKSGRHIIPEQSLANSTICVFSLTEIVNVTKALIRKNWISKCLLNRYNSDKVFTEDFLENPRKMTVPVGSKRCRG